MNFSDKIQDQFQKAGWSEGRDVSDVYEIEQFQEYPESLKEFLYEYGNLYASPRPPVCNWWR